MGIRESFIKKIGFELGFEQFVEMIKRGSTKEQRQKVTRHG